MKTREEIKQYALDICIPMLEAAAERRISRRPIEICDRNSYVASELEEMFRPFWGIAPILNEQKIYLNIRGKRAEVGEWLREVLVTGTDPQSEYYWNKHTKKNGDLWFNFQTVTEFAGLLLGCYFAKSSTWDLLTKEEQKQVADYINSACVEPSKHLAENNHIWFPILCFVILRRFGFEYTGSEELINRGLDKLDTMYVGGGWYSDGDLGRTDYYVAWSMHSYPLLYCLIEDPLFPHYNERRAKYLERTGEFLCDYARLFDGNGAYPPFGRSLAYRFAASCVFPLAVLAGVNTDVRIAGEITRRNITYFKENVLTGHDNILPVGYMYNSPSQTENYTSSGGPYWAAKSFLCLFIQKDNDFWKNTELPIEKGGYVLHPKDSRLNFFIAGTNETGVTVYNNHFQYYQKGIYCNQFNDMAGLYCKFCYNSLSGFALSCRDTVSSDNMISLKTADHSMVSHRWGFKDLGKDHEIMISEHIPFSNDGKTVIKTWMLILEGSLHIRIHKVTLSQKYAVKEGGFSIGMWDDYRESSEKNGVFMTKTAKYTSYIKTVASVPTSYSEKYPQPGMHLMAPLSVYPAYDTGLLNAGEYIFASFFAVAKNGTTDITVPNITINGNTVNIEYKQKSYKVRVKE